MLNIPIIRRIPRNIRHHPLGVMMMLTWGLLGAGMETSNDKPWPDLFWAGVEYQFGDIAGQAAMTTVALSMMLASVLFLVAHPLSGRLKSAAYVRWVGLWVALFTSALLLFGSVWLWAFDMARFSTWPFTIAIWAVYTVGFVLALRVANCSDRCRFGINHELIRVEGIE